MMKAEPPHPELDDTPEQLEIIAKALYDHAVKTALDQLAAVVLPTEKIIRVLLEASKASDREAAIVTFCLIDDIATDFFRQKLTGKVSEGIDETFFKGNGILSTANNKFTLLGGLEWIRHDTYRAISFLRKIRNEFAHHVEYRGFSDNPIRGYLDAIGKLEAPIINIWSKDHPLPVLDLRQKFLIRSAITVLNFTRDLYVIQAAIAQRVPPSSVGSEFDRQPENMKNISRAISGHVLGIISGENRHQHSTS